MIYNLDLKRNQIIVIRVLRKTKNKAQLEIVIREEKSTK